MKRWIAIGLVALMGFSIAGCSSDEPVDGGKGGAAKQTEKEAEGDKGAQKAADSETIRIGLYGTITGPNAIAGEMLDKGAQIAIKEVNEAGGINGKQLELVVYDDKSNPEGALKAVTRLVDVDKVKAMVGSNSSPNILGTVEVTEKAKVLQVGAGTSPTYTNANYKYLFRGTANGELPNAAAVKGMKEMGVKTIGILSVAAENGESGIKSFKALMGDDIKVVAEEKYQATDTDYTGQIAKIINANPDGVLIYGMTNESALAIKQFRRNGYEGYIYGPEAMGVTDLLNVAGEEADNVIFGSAAVVPASVEDATNEIEKKMLQAFVDEYGSMPISDVVYRGYDGVRLIAEALKTCKDINDPESIREAFVNLKGVELTQGTYDFSEATGDGLKEAKTFIIQGGKHLPFESWRAENPDK